MCPDVPSRKGLNGLVVSGCNMQVLAWGAEDACRLPHHTCACAPIVLRKESSERATVAIVYCLDMCLA